MNVNVERSEKWLAARQVETGKNIGRYVKVEVDPLALSVESREAVVGCYGCYPENLEHMTYNDRYEWSRHSGYGSMSVKIDADAPTAEQIDAAIRKGVTEVEEKRAAARAKRDAAETKAAARAAAREMLKGEFANMQAEIDRWKERHDSRRAELYVVSEFLSAVPEDALRGTLKAVCNSEEQIAAKRKEVEDASPVTIFADDEE